MARRDRSFFFDNKTGKLQSKGKVIADATNTDNIAQLKGSTTGNPVQLISVGDDTNIDLRLSAKGAGNIELLSTLEILTGKRIIDSAGTNVEFGDPIQMNSNKIVGLGTPTASTDAATKAYVDSGLSSLSSTTLTEGNSTLVVADSGTGTITATIDGTTHSVFAAAGITLSQGEFVGNVTGNADTADAWSTARTLSLTGAVTGSASIDGSGNVSLATTATSDPVITLTGAVTGSGTMTNLGNVSIATTATNDPTITLAGDATGSVTLTNLGNGTLTVAIVDDSHNHIIGNVDGLQTALDAKAPLASPALTGTATAVNLTVSGDLTVNGTTTTLNTTNTVVSDNLIELNNGVTSNANDSGIVIERGTTGDNAFMGWDESADRFILGTTTATGASTGDLTITAAPLSVSTLTTSGNITVGGTVDGRDVATDGTKLDGIESGATADQTASEILTAIKTVDGAGSGLDADLLDGQQGSYYTNASNLSSGTIPAARIPAPTSGDWWNGTPAKVGTDGVMEIGKYIDFHNTDTATSDYDVRLHVSGTNELTISGAGVIWNAGNDGSGSGLDADTLDGQHAAAFLTGNQTITLSGDVTGSGTTSIVTTVVNDSHTHDTRYYTEAEADARFTSIDHFRHTGTGNYTSTTTADLLTEALGDDAFDSYLTAHKTGWSYAGNGDLTDAGRLTELAGTSWLWWTDNSADNTQGNITALCIAPNTGGSAGKMFVYNNQGASYSPGWREIWTNTSDGAGSGLDADLLDGQQGSYYLDYNNFTNTPTIPTNNNQLTNGAGYITSTVTGTLTATNVIATSNGTGTAYRVGDDAYIGDINVANTLNIKGVQNGDRGYITFGNNATQLGRITTGALTWGGQTIWHAGNDGSGSGLDADTLDGVQGASYLRSDAADIATGQIQLQSPNNIIRIGNTNNTTTAETTGLNLHGNYTTGQYAHRLTKYDHGGGVPLYVDGSDGTANIWTHLARFGTYTGNSYEFEVFGDINATGNLYDGGNAVWHAGNDGSGSGLDADLLDGVQGSSYLRSDATDTFTTLNGTQLGIGSQIILKESTDRADLLLIQSQTSSWGGIQIQNSSGETLTSFMGNDNSFGIYDDLNNEWSILCSENGDVNLYHNGSVKLTTQSTGISVTGVMTGTATAARYADLAERYAADAEYIPGTVLIFGGEKEVTQSTSKMDRRKAGVVSTDPAHLMNAEAGDDTTHPAVALQGRVPCRVVGEVRKGDLMITSSVPGCAEAWREEGDPRYGSVIGKSLVNKTSTKEELIEVAVGVV